MRAFARPAASLRRLAAPSLRTRSFGVLDTMRGAMENRANSSKEKAFQAEVSRLIERSKYTLEDFKETLKSGVGGGWRSYVPGATSEATKAVAAQLKIIEHCTADELAHPMRALRGRGQQRLMEASGASKEEISGILQQYEHISLMQVRWKRRDAMAASPRQPARALPYSPHALTLVTASPLHLRAQRWLYKRKTEGEAMPTSEEHLQTLIRQNPQSLNAMQSKRAKKRAMGRRG